jgi:hypothetical protein
MYRRRFWFRTRLQHRFVPWSGLWAVGLVLTVAGCGAPATVSQTPVATQPTTQFDGAYQSTIRITGSNRAVQGNWCDSVGQSVITITNGQFSYAVPHPDVPGNPTLTFAVNLTQNGTFASQINGGSISGRVQGTHIEGSIDGEACAYAFTGDKM